MPNVKEIFYELSSTLGYLVNRLIGNKEPSIIKGKKKTIVAIDGFGGGWTERGLGNYLRKRGLNGYFVDLGFQLKSLEEYTDNLNSFIKKEKISEPVLLGYSMGGLIAVFYAEKYGWNKIKKIITIASPFNTFPSLCKRIILPSGGHAAIQRYNKSLYQTLDKIL